MKKFIALAALVLMSMVTTTVYAQESNAQRRADRKAQRDAERARLKAEQQAADAVSYDDAVAALKAQKFVLEANQVMFTSNTNFVLVNQARGTVQVAFNTVYPGPNGIGGVTVDGTVSDMKMSTDKRGNINCNFSIQGIGISAQIFLTLTNGGNNATVTISPNFNSNTMTLSGSLLPLNQSNIFKGRSW